MNSLWLLGAEESVLRGVPGRNTLVNSLIPVSVVELSELVKENGYTV